MAADIKSAGECLKAVNILFEELKNAKRSLINSEFCTVNRNLMQAQLEYLRNNLPDTVTKAAAIVEDQNKQNEWYDQQAKILAGYGDFSAYERLYGKEAADRMRKIWDIQNPTLTV